MSTRTVCDGCGADTPKPTVTGTRTDGLGGCPLPDGEWHWCANCALVAFATVKATADTYRAAYAINPAVAARPHDA